MYRHQPRPRYCAYLLRCWQEQSFVHVGRTVWRFSLEDPHTGERRGFATWEAVVAFLKAELRDEVGGAQDGSSDREAGQRDSN
jgi:hypothetical protein